MHLCKFNKFRNLQKFFRGFVKFCREFSVFRNPYWFLHTRSHWEVKITARNPDNLVEFLQKFTAQHHPRWGVFNRVLAHAIKLQILKKFVRFGKKCTFECNSIAYPDTSKAENHCQEPKKIENWMPFECTSIWYTENSKNLKLLKKV